MSINGFGQSTKATNFSVSQVEGAQLPPGGPQPPPASLSAAVADSRISTDTYTQSQAATALLASTVAAPPQETNASSTSSVTTATPSVSSPSVSAQTTTTQAQNPATAVVAQDNASNTNYVQQFEQSEAPPPYTLATAVPNPNKENSRPLAATQFNAFQIRQFSDLVKTIRSITSAVLPNFSFSA